MEVIRAKAIRQSDSHSPDAHYKNSYEQAPKLVCTSIDKGTEKDEEQPAGGQRSEAEM
jgi:hypothetical protein